MSVKVVVAGGFGVGKTTFVSALSDIPPLTTEAHMTSRAAGVDDHAGAQNKTTTTVALDFGRITVDDLLVLYLFGTPGQDRFGFMWDDISKGALGAVVLVDPARIDQSFPALDYFEQRDIPFAVGVNLFEGGDRYPVDEVRAALDLPTDVPMVELDARNTGSAKHALLALLTRLAQRKASGS